MGASQKKNIESVLDGYYHFFTYQIHFSNAIVGCLLCSALPSHIRLGALIIIQTL